LKVLDDLSPAGYNLRMKFELQSTENFDRWFFKLKDKSVKARILARFSRIENGNFGDYKQIQANLFELRFFFGNGFRVYYTVQRRQVVLLLMGGDKSTQNKDIEKAIALLKEIEE
jgi:putative addiction module killer protein